MDVATALFVPPLERDLPVTQTADPITRETVTPPSVKEIRDNFNERARAKSTFKGVTLFVISMTVYVLGYWGFIALQGWGWKIAMVAVFTTAIPMLFVIGHDA